MITVLRGYIGVWVVKTALKFEHSCANDDKHILAQPWQ